MGPFESNNNPMGVDSNLILHTILHPKTTPNPNLVTRVFSLKVHSADLF